ncbi:MAG: glutathione S-transferase [Rhodospirillaceae bacterium]|nr:glutathione S-transferase [Rhodospirillaceae bacterium]|tara:strand:+ start:469 stop:1068 length:600 start_codon:yes stop_codon:yes gene_type:complete
MKCYATSNSPYARKVRIAALETGVYGKVDWQMITREERAEIVPDINPLGKVPVAVLNSGHVLCDSPVICAYVDSLSSDTNLIPKSGSERWEVLTLEALGDGLGEAVIAASQEDQRPGEKRSQGVVDRQVGKANATLNFLNHAAKKFNSPPLMGEIAVACALGYMEFRDVVPGWRDKYANLGSWYAEVLKRQSFIDTNPD